MDEDFYLLWLSQIESIGIKKQNILLEFFKTGAGIYNASKYDLAYVKGITENNIYKILEAKENGITPDYIEVLEKKKIKFISRANCKYFKALKNISDPPIGFYMMGEIPKDDDNFLAVIGSRRSSDYGKIVSHQICKDLSKCGIVIVSGMARGIDSMAHKGTIDSSGKTIAVMGCGVDVCYPPENRNLREQIIENGCIISEYPVGTKPLPAYFPARNRIISGISRGTLVVEASKRSGTLITVSQALEQGRDVFAVPGNITSNLSVGTNELLKDGAILVTNYKDICDAWNIDYEVKKETCVSIMELSDEQKTIYESIFMEPVSFDTLLKRNNLLTPALNYNLTILEIKGYITKLAGQRFVRKK